MTVALALPLMLRDFVWPEGDRVALAAATGATAQVGQMALTRGIQLLPASRATAYSYTQIVFASLLGAWLFGESPDAFTAAGAALVLTGAWLAGRSGGAERASPSSADAKTGTFIEKLRSRRAEDPIPDSFSTSQ